MTSRNIHVGPYGVNHMFGCCISGVDELRSHIIPTHINISGLFKYNFPKSILRFIKLQITNKQEPLNYDSHNK